MEDEGDVELINCNTCGRHFRSEVLQKHEPICIKSSKKKRKIFNSGKQRAEGSDIPINKVLKPGEIPKSDPKTAIAEAKTKNWREKHNSLVESLRAAREYAKAKTSGGVLPPPPPAVIDSSLVQCPHCQRRFNEESSKRHIPFCKEHQMKTLPKSNTAATKKPHLKVPLSKGKLDLPPTHKITVPLSNGTNQRTSPQSLQSAKCRNEDLMVNKTKSSEVPTRSTVIVARQSPALLAAGVSRGSSSVSTVAHKPSSLPRGTMSTRKSNIPAPKSSASSAGYCHECGSSFVVASARFCSECGVRRLAL